jgi:hypothetical protein
VAYISNLNIRSFLPRSLMQDFYMSMHVLFFVFCATMVLSPAKAYGLCREIPIILAEKQKIRKELSVNPGECRTISFAFHWPLALSGIRIVKRPSRSSIGPSSNGIGGAHDLRANSMASGNDSYVVRAELTRYVNGTGGTRVSEQTWAEVEFLLTYGK